MLIIREVFTAKPGQASKLAKLFKKSFGQMPTVRVMTDLVGNYNTVVAEFEMKNLMEFEQMMKDYKSGKMDSKMDPDVAGEMSQYTEMFMSGHREIFEIVE